MSSAVRVYRTPELYEALKAEGYELPDECGDILLELPVDGLPCLVFRVHVTPELLQILGRAFIRMGTNT